jgi:effector-binding domain-containing protein
MIETPQVTQTDAQITAVIHLTIHPSEMRDVVGPGIGELMQTVAAQGVGPAGPWFIHQLRSDAEVMDFEIGVPVSSPVSPAGRVQPGELPAATVARTVHHGPYEELMGAWEAFGAWIAAEGHTPVSNLWEVYAVGPESTDDPKGWRTELNRPLAG